MTTDRTDRPRTGWLALLALPVVCCAAHAVALALGVGSLAALTGAAAGSTPLVAAGLLGAAAVVTVRWRRRRQR